MIPAALGRPSITSFKPPSSTEIHAAAHSHHSSGSRPTGDSAGSPLRSGVSWLGMALVAACFLAEDGALEAHALRRPLDSKQVQHPGWFIFQNWSGCGESNTGYPVPKTGDMPLAYTPKKNGSPAIRTGRPHRFVSMTEELVSRRHRLAVNWLRRRNSNP